MNYSKIIFLGFAGMTSIHLGDPYLMWMSHLRILRTVEQYSLRHFLDETHGDITHQEIWDLFLFEMGLNMRLPLQ